MKLLRVFILLAFYAAVDGVGFYPHQLNTGSSRWRFNNLYDYFIPHQTPLLDYYDDYLYSEPLQYGRPGDFVYTEPLNYYDTLVNQNLQPFEPLRLPNSIYNSYDQQYTPLQSQDFSNSQPFTRYQKSYRKKKQKKRKYKMVKLPQKKKKKMKIVSVDLGFYIPGGIQVFKKFYDIKGCMKACARTPSCFAGDFNEWFGKCYIHTNSTACNTMKNHKKITHFKKVPCTIPEAPRGLVILGAQLHFAIEQKHIDSLTECIKKCATAGQGIPDTNADLNLQVCFGIDYDFSSHKCFFHVQNTRPENRICGGATIDTPRDLVANSGTVFIALCPDV